MQLYAITFKRFLSLLFLLLFHLGMRAQDLPPIQNFAMSDYGAGSQNWSISQDSGKNIYFGNNAGLLEFNGSRWKLYTAPNGTIIRSVEVIEDMVYTGFYMDFGFWKRDVFGDFQYTSLLDKLDLPLIEDEHFWNITSRDEWILFQSLDRIYLYNTSTEKFDVIDFKSNRAMIFNLEEGIFVQSPGKGLFMLKNGGIELISSQDIFIEDTVIGLYDRPDGRLIITEKGRFYLWDRNGFEEWEVDAVVESKNINLYSSYQLDDGSLMLGTVSNGFIHMGDSGEVLHHVNQENGLINNTVLAIFEDADSNVWLGLDNGISIVNIQSAFSEFIDTKGKLGAVYSSFVSEDWLYLGTNQGLFCKNLKLEEGFKMIKNTNGQVWNLKSIDGSLFCGHNKGTFIIEGDEAILISDNSGTWDVIPVPDNKNLLLQGNYNGLSILEKKNNEWHYRNQVSGFEISSRSFVIENDLQIIVNHEFKGLFILTLDSDFENVIETKTKDRIGYDSNISRFGADNIFSSNHGVHIFDTDQNKLIPNEFLNSLFYNESDRISGKLIFEPKEDKLWGFSSRNIICMEQDLFDGEPRAIKIAIPKDFRQNQGLIGFENVFALGANEYLIGTSTGYVLLDFQKKQPEEFSVYINKITKHYGNGEIDKASLEGYGLLPFDQNDLSIQFNVPEYDKYTDVDFQYKLIGLYDEWTPWSTETLVYFGNLSYGKYSFVVRARIGNVMSTNEAAYDFEIARPWYLSLIAIAFYTVGLAILLIMVHRSYKKYYSRQQKELMEQSERNLELTRLANEREIMNLKNEQLQKDIENKNRELTMATMSLINKNELLLGLKKDLSSLEDKGSRDQVIRTIDRNLNNDRDWAHFEEAFNNADKDFLKKVHKLHPELTPSDLKLCAYLRLNLSSKEIAPLLNISVRSVEIKRYRLRKKMALKHEKSLVEYILEI